MKETMDYTGERMVPEQAEADTFWEHIYRYRFAAQFVAGKRVLDIACGEGYGAAALSQSGAQDIIGVDVSAEACEHAARRYGIEARLGDAQNIPLPNGAVDTVVSFETIEHISHPEKFLDECVRVLQPGGRLIISTPNRNAYLKDAPQNPYHLKELTEAEFIGLLAARFRNLQIYTQRPAAAGWWSLRLLASASALWEVRGFRRLRWLLQKKICPETVDLKKLEQARINPIQAILNHPDGWAHLANPFAIRPRSKFAREIPIYVIAVATL